MNSTAIEYAPSSIWLPTFVKKHCDKHNLQFNRDSAIVAPGIVALMSEIFFQNLIRTLVTL